MLQYGTRINVYSTVCKALTSQLTNESLDELCHHRNKNKNLPSSSSSSSAFTANLTEAARTNTEINASMTMSPGSTLRPIDIEIQYLSGLYLLVYRFLLNIPAVISCLFYGSYAHKIGHKYIMLIPCLGSISACFFFIISLSSKLKFIPDSIILTLIGATFYGVCGKSSAVTMGVNSYISENSVTQKRTRMLARLLGVNFLGLSLGTLFLGVFYQFSNYFDLLIFVIVGDLFAILLIFLATYLKNDEKLSSSSTESSVTSEISNEITSTMTETSPSSSSENQLHDDKTDENHKDSGNSLNYKENILWYKRILHGIVKPFKTVISSYTFLFKKRDNNRRLYLIIILATILFKQMAKSGEQDVTLLYLTNEPTLLWSAELYAFYTALYYSLMFIQLIILLPILEKKFAFRDTTLILIGLVSEAIRLFVTGLVKNTVILFLTAVLGSMASFITTCTRSLISKLVHGDEMNASFAVISILETLANLMGGALFTLIYNKSLLFYPPFIFILSAVLNIPLIFIFIWLRYKLLIYEVYCSEPEKISSNEETVEKKSETTSL
ncbi:unnamed protein product [Trichobilharzia szidati]|nr:unnamed protein product [Trichobilharzia szidati]